MKEKKYGVTYYPKHIYKIIRWDYKKGGGPTISPHVFDEIVLNQIFTRSIIEFSLLMPNEKLFKAIESVDYEIPDDLIRAGLKVSKKRLPVDIIDLGFKIDKFVRAHGPFSPLAIGAMNTIIWMGRLGITDCKVYFKLMEYLDDKPAESFTDYVRIVTEFEKGME